MSCFEIVMMLIAVIGLTINAIGLVIHIISVAREFIVWWEDRRNAKEHTESENNGD